MMYRIPIRLARLWLEDYTNPAAKPQPEVLIRGVSGKRPFRLSMRRDREPDPSADRDEHIHPKGGLSAANEQRPGEHR